MKRLIKYICYKTIVDILKFESKIRFKGVAHFILKWEAVRNYRYFMCKDIDWNNPIDLNEKINWLKFYSDCHEWSNLADKYKVREFIKIRGKEDTLIPLYGVWDKAGDINFDQLPLSFVLKTNHGSGDVIVVRDKNQININDVVEKIDSFMKMPYGVGSGEPHYLYIKPKVVAEQLLVSDDVFSTSLVDYKIWCFDGEPYYIMVCYSRTQKEVNVEIYDLEWNYHPEYSVFNNHYVNGGGIVPKPSNFDEMLDLARELSCGFKQVRVDLYNQGGKVYFGEMTFTSNGGYMDYFTQEFLNIMGSQISIL